jgi:pyruvate/2-oxoglutarate/acetoin dehydrogenase E1 component
VLLLGEDIVDPYGGAFKVTKGLSTIWPGRVLSTPISEAAIVGVANGLALDGFKPIVEIMFGDFLTLAVDQIVNHAAKFRGMYADKASSAIVVRAPMGGRRGYGPTHSQTIESFFLGVPGLEVVSANELIDLERLLPDLLRDRRDPLLFIENKTLYGRENRIPKGGRLEAFSIRSDDHPASDLVCSLNGFQSTDLTLVANGGMVPLALEAAMILAIDDEIFAEVVIPARLHPFDPSNISDSVAKSGALLVAEEGQIPWGWGSEIAARCLERRGGFAFARVGAKIGVIPASKRLEDAHLPQTRDIIEAARRLTGGKS